MKEVEKAIKRIKEIKFENVNSYHQNELLCGRFAWPRNYHSLFRDAEEFDISDDYLDNIDKLDFILYMKAEDEDSICNYMSNRGYKLYKI